ncbi:hypothetical protein F5I97DRAFT_1808104 [Phlebopus sp. FC_14]|nr:hypothetical protein F5I97DRAFT_1808104 [Phlebopus sp. FC_14]
MSVRSFTVFQDTPTELSPSHHDSDDASVNATASEAAVTLLSTLAAIEKENLHPLTGERAGPASSENKKRKTVALSTKLLVVPSSKKHKELKPDSKKSRKPPSSGEKPKSSDGRRRANSAKGSRTSRKTSPLPPVDEELESQRDPARLLITQATIDSRCYELTVSPLADVSDAYDTRSRAESQEPEKQPDQDVSAEPESCDYFSPAPAEKPLSSPEAKRSDDALTCQHTDISTPERKRTYSEFTFSSPSPSSERFRETRSSPIRGDVAAIVL